jgi:hypothetical protein
MLDLTIESLHLHLEDGKEQQHRVRSISTRAMSLLLERLDLWETESRLDPANRLTSIAVPPVTVDFKQRSDEQVAQAIAAALEQAIAVHLKVPM